MVSATGSFSSPSYPNQYMHSRVCEWRITVQIGHQINLYFADFDVEDSSTCVFDSVKVIFHSQSYTHNLTLCKSHEICIHYVCKGFTDLSLLLLLHRMKTCPYTMCGHSVLYVEPATCHFTT